MADKLSREDVLKLARLARLKLSEDEITKYQLELSSILSFVEQLKTIELSGYEPTNQVNGLVNVKRSDEVLTQPSLEVLLRNVPNTEGKYIKVKRMVV